MAMRKSCILVFAAAAAFWSAPSGADDGVFRAELSLLRVEGIGSGSGFLSSDPNDALAGPEEASLTPQLQFSFGRRFGDWTVFADVGAAAHAFGTTDKFASFYESEINLRLAGTDTFVDPNGQSVTSNIVTLTPTSPGPQQVQFARDAESNVNRYLLALGMERDFNSGASTTRLGFGVFWQRDRQTAAQSIYAAARQRDFTSTYNALATQRTDVTIHDDFAGVFVTGATRFEATEHIRLGMSAHGRAGWIDRSTTFFQTTQTSRVETSTDFVIINRPFIPREIASGASSFAIAADGTDFAYEFGAEVTVGWEAVNGHTLEFFAGRTWQPDASGVELPVLAGDPDVQVDTRNRTIDAFGLRLLVPFW